MSLRGHDAAWAEWRAALGSERMHHAWILAGPRGIGDLTQLSRSEKQAAVVVAAAAVAGFLVLRRRKKR